MPSLVKDPQPARYGAANALKMLMYCRVHSAAGQVSECREARDGESGVSAISALSHARLRLFQQARKIPLAAIAALASIMILVPASGRAEEPLRDPTRPYSAAQDARVASPRFVVNAIIISPQRRVAIVNGRRVAVGGSLDGATIVAIEKSQLILDVGGKRVTARLNDEATHR